MVKTNVESTVAGFGRKHLTVKVKQSEFCAFLTLAQAHGFGGCHSRA